MKPVEKTFEILAFKALGRDIDGRTLVDWAIDMLVAGYNTEYLTILAGEREPFNPFQIEKLVNNVLSELQLDYSDMGQTIRNYAYYLIGISLNNEIDSYEVLGILKRICAELEYEESWMDFFLLYYAKDDLLYSENQYYWDGATRENIDQIILEYFIKWKSNYEYEVKCMEKYKNCIKDFLDLINKYEHEIGGNIFTQNNKTNDKEIDIFKKWISKYYEHDISDYIQFMKKVNGFCFGVSTFYSLNPDSIVGSDSNYIDSTYSNSIYKHNEVWWQDEKLGQIFQQYVIFSDDGSISIYCINKDNGKYYRIDNCNGKILEEYETFDELILRALEVSLYSGDSGFDEEYEKIKRKYGIN